MIRRAGPDDIPPLTAFLRAHRDTSMFLLSNLLAHGVNDPDHPHGTTFFLRLHGDRIAGVLGRTNDGFLLCQIPGLSPPTAAAWTGVLHGYAMRGMSGDAAQVVAFLSALPVPDSAFKLNTVEPLLALDLAPLSGEPPVTRHADAADVALLTAWFAEYMAETGTAPPGDPMVTARARAERAVGSPDLRLLIEQDSAVAMAGINAAAGDMVQVGGVYVPPALRGAGRAGRVVTGLLAARRAMGARRAILFAASDTATRVYERIGFARIGDYRIALLATPVRLGPQT